MLASPLTPCVIGDNFLNTPELQVHYRTGVIINASQNSLWEQRKQVNTLYINYKIHHMC